MFATRTFIVGLVVACGVAGATVVSSAQLEQDALDWGKSFDGLQLSLYVDPLGPHDSSMPAVRIAIRNSGTSAKLIVLGAGCGNVNQTNSVTLEFKDEQGQQHQLQDSTRDLPCGGRLAVFKVTLPAGSFFSTPLALQNYGSISPTTHKFEAGFQPGSDYVVRAVIRYDPFATFDIIDSQVPFVNVPERLSSNELYIKVAAQH